MLDALVRLRLSEACSTPSVVYSVRSSELVKWTEVVLERKALVTWYHGARRASSDLPCCLEKIRRSDLALKSCRTESFFSYKTTIATSFRNLQQQHLFL